jgi:signal transduction histidine kinase/CheY-like chemotaxis protein
MTSELLAFALALMIALLLALLIVCLVRLARQNRRVEDLQRRHTLAQLQLEHVTPILMLLDHHGRTVLHNKPLPKQWQQQSLFEGAPVSPNCMARWMSQPQQRRSCIFWLTPEKASRRWRCCLTPLADQPYWILQAEDINDRLLKQRSAEERYLQLQQQSESRSRFLASMSHEIRTPMTGLLGTVSLMEQTELNSEQQSLLETMQHSAEHLLTIINDILDLSKIEAGKLAISEQPFAPRQLLQELLESVRGYRHSKEGAEVLLESDVAPTVADRLLGDVVRIRQILMNFLTNALKFTVSGSIRLELKPLPEKDWVVFSVTDSGEGIDAEQALQLFEEYAQGQQAANQTSGTGLGLHICKRLARLMGGRVGVISMPGEGACFWLELQLPAVQEAEAPSIKSERAIAATSLANVRILLAEDNLVNQKVAVQMLERLGCQVTLAVKGEQAVEQWQPDQFDLVLMDCHMPVMDGIEATRRIRAREQQGQRTTIVALSADVMGEQRKACDEAGMDGYLSKPIRLQELQRQLPRFLSQNTVAQSTLP